MSRNQIDILYKPNKEEKVLLKEEHTHEAWDDGRFAFFKENLIAHLREEQEYRCCYCKMLISGETNQTHIEHIIAKSRNGRFTYSLKNLALCCINCNTTKSAKSVYIGNLEEDELKVLPGRSVSYSIVHPHLDRFDQHIEFFAGAIAREVNDSEKGRVLIEVCNLHRYGLITNKVRDEIISGKSQVHKKVLEIHRSGRTEQEKIINEFIAELFDFI